MGTRLPVIKNPVYSEILLRLGTERVHINKFVDWFCDDIDSVSTKKQSVLYRQMIFLKEKGYLLSTDRDESGEKLGNNIQLYYINFKKIIEEFISYGLKRFEDQDKDKLEEAKKVLGNKKFIERSKNNKILLFLFSEYFQEIRKLNFDKKTILIEDLFNNIFYGGYLDSKIEKAVCEILLDKGIKLEAGTFFSKVDLDKYKKHMDNDAYGEFRFFQEFVSEIGMHNGLNHFPQEQFPFEIAEKIVDGFNGTDLPPS